MRVRATLQQQSVPFYNWYFNSNKIYQDFGFSKYIPIEYFKPTYSGPYIADSEVAANIIHATEQSAGSDFVFANTMENHFHFYPGKFPKNTFDVTGNFSHLRWDARNTCTRNQWVRSHVAGISGVLREKRGANDYRILGRPLTSPW